MFGLSRSQSEFIANKISTDDSYDIVRTYQQTTSERSKYDFLFELAYPLVVSFFVAAAVVSVAAVTSYFSFALFGVVFFAAAGLLYAVIFIMHTTKEVSFSESEKYKQIAKRSEQGKSIQTEDAQVITKTVRLEVEDIGKRQVRLIDFQGIDDKDLLAVAVHCLMNGNSFSKHSLDGVISTTQYPKLLDGFSSAGLLREVDNRGTKEITPAGRAILSRYIEAV